MYRRFCVGLEDKGKLIPANDPISQHADLGNPFKDYYLSIYKYNETHYENFKQNKTVSGIIDVVTDKLIFDFDKENGVEDAQSDTQTTVNRLVAYGIDSNNIRVFYSANKGFHVEVNIDQDITPNEFKSITKQIAGDLKTFDVVVSNPSRILRVVGSVHKKTGLYKIPLTLEELNNLKIEEIKNIAKSWGNIDRSKFSWGVSSLPEAIEKLKKLKEDKVSLKIVDVQDIDWASKPKWLSNCRFSLQNGRFGYEEGQRNNAFMVLCTTYKNQGFDKGAVYRLLKAAAEKQAEVTGRDRYSDKELWEKVIGPVFAPTWKGGQFSCRNATDWIHGYCQSLGSNKCKHNEDNCFIEMEDFAAKFKDFAINIDNNTLKLGVPLVDDKVMITTSMLVGLLGAPSVGKTTLLLNFLEQSNKDDIESCFFSMDMGLPLVYLRLIQKHFGISRDKVFQMFLEDPQGVSKIIDTIKNTYSKTKFSFKTGLTVDGIKNAVLDHQEKTGKKVKLIGVDYLECISGPFSDPTANTGVIANQLKDIANELDTCVMLLLQTQKQSGDPSDPLLSMRNVKGSSVIEQACSVILSMSRPGFSPITPENDNFATISTVKDRMGSLMSIDTGWKGLTGTFYRLDDEQEQDLKTIRDKKAEAKAASNGGF